MDNISKGYVSADGHVVEPADLWTTRMDKRFRERAPRVEARDDADYYIIDGLTPFPVGLEGASMEDKLAGNIETSASRHADTRPGAWDPQQRLVDQDMDHVRAEVIYAGAFGLQFYTVKDAEYQREAMRVYNDWLSEFCAFAPGRLLGAGILPMRGPIEWACAEAERCAKKGLKTLTIPADVPDRSYATSDYEKLWATLQEIGLPVATHSGTGTDEEFQSKYQRMGTGMAVVEMKMFQPMRGMVDLLWSGAPERFPKLRFVIAEGGIGWMASMLGFMDHWWNDHKKWIEPKLSEAPSTYFKRQFWATFEDDRAGIQTRDILGVDRLMWGADYPHTEGTFPNSVQQISKDFVGVPEEELYKIVAGNAERLYGIGS